MEIKELAEQAIDKLKSNPELLKQFQSDPVKALENISGIDLPDDKIQPVITAIKAKLASGNVADSLGKLGGLFK